MLPVSPSILNILNLHVGEKVQLNLDQGQLVIKSIKQPRYSLDELLAQCDSSAEFSAEDLE